MQFEAAANADPKNAERMDVVYKITEGQRVNVNRVVVTGLEYTRPYIVNRQMRIRGRRPAQPERMVDSQRRLYNLGLFNEVDMAVQNPEGIEPQKGRAVQPAGGASAGRSATAAASSLRPATFRPPAIRRARPESVPTACWRLRASTCCGRDQTLTFRGPAWFADAPRDW